MTEYLRKDDVLSTLARIGGIGYRALDRIKAMPAENLWIPCSERLPNYGARVLTYSRDDVYEINHIIDEEDGEWFWDGVIAWMPLPEPYTEDKQ